jgi:hypothetical protein
VFADGSNATKNAKEELNCVVTLLDRTFNESDENYSMIYKIP